MTQLREQYWAVEVPDKYAQVTIDPVGPILMWWSYEGTETGVNLPPGTWEIVCTSKEATEEQLTGIIGPKIWGGFSGHIEGYTDYYTIGMDIAPFSTRKESFNSLLNAKGCDLNKNWLILKKIK